MILFIIKYFSIYDQNLRTNLADYQNENSIMINRATSKK